MSDLESRIKDGRVVSCANPRHGIESLLIGEGVSTKVNANVGTSPGNSSVDAEIEKALLSIEYGADAIMDLSVGDKVDETRKAIIKAVDVAVGTVPVYQMFMGRDIADVDLDVMLEVIEKHCKDGVDFLTIHCGVTKHIVEELMPKRLIPVTSRGGSLLARWIRHHKRENPLYENFEKVCEILKEYEVVLSLGDGLRPGCIHDATDEAQLEELKRLGEFTLTARKMGVQIIIEGPGHVPLDQIEYNMKIQKKICHNAPFYVLGPLVTDIGVGYDHITGAIGGALAAMHGADFLCYVTPSEHLGLPKKDDVINGVVASKIAAHAADLVKLGDTSRDDAMSRARKCLDWDEMFKNALFPQIRAKYPHLKGKDACSMCEEYCALKYDRD
ncbi:MAG TPA: phosphomethylpyrimidine synthase ThiC [Candidatus Altiarchaeales archaeon]|nr:phosphomethylpyrimidine synthase ThiC [Candidatus Altiarchaeales archaeon]